MAAIAGNSVVLALHDYKDANNRGSHNQRLAVCSDVFTWLFCAEAIINIVSLGFIGRCQGRVYIKNGKVVSRKAYLRDPWNQLDFLIVVSGVLGAVLASDPSEQASGAGEEDGAGGLIQTLRLLRVLRPLKSIKTLPGMQALVAALILALPELAHVAIFFLFVFMLFGIVGLQEFSGLMYNRCRLDPEPTKLANGRLFWRKSEEHS